MIGAPCPNLRTQMGFQCLDHEKRNQKYLCVWLCMHKLAVISVALL